MIKWFFVILMLITGYNLYQNQHTSEVNTEVSTTTPTQNTEKKSITIYTATWCGYCHTLKEKLTASAIPFTEYDIENSTEGKSYMDKRGERFVPITVIGDETILGYDEELLPPAFLNAGYQLQAL